MIEALEKVNRINGIKAMTNDDRPVDDLGDVDWQAFDEMRDEYPICIDHEKDMISFKMMTKSLEDGGDLRNAQVTELVTVALIMLDKLNQDNPCRENGASIMKLEEVIMWQNKRISHEIRVEENRRMLEEIAAKKEKEALEDIEEVLEDIEEVLEEIEHGLDSDKDGNPTLAVMEEEYPCGDDCEGCIAQCEPVLKEVKHER